MDNVMIYSLSDPRTGEIRYVGKTIDASMRMSDHLRKRHGNYKNHWVQSLIKLGLKPIMEPLEIIKDCNDKDWQEVERFWISYLRFLGCSLTNLESGGMSGKRLSLESRIKLSKALKGNKNALGYIPSKETREKISLANKGKKRTPEQCLWASTVRIGKPNFKLRGHKASEETKRKQSESAKLRTNRGPRSDATKEKLRQAFTGRPIPLEQRAKISASLKARNQPSWNKGRSWPAETKAKVRAAKLGKPSNRKGKKCDKPAWNKGLKRQLNGSYA